MTGTFVEASGRVRAVGNAKTSGNKKVMVYENLKRRIIDCSLAPGLPINEADFAGELGVSKTPVREARELGAG